MASLFIKLLNFCQSDCEKWLSQYSFNLHFSYHEWSWTSFDRFKGNYPFHGEFSTHISWPFFYSIWPFICNTYSPSLQIFLSVYHLSFEFTFLFVMQEFFFLKQILSITFLTASRFWLLSLNSGYRGIHPCFLLVLLQLHLQSILVYGIWERTNLSFSKRLLLSQDHLLKRPSIPQWLRCHLHHIVDFHM